MWAGAGLAATRLWGGGSGLNVVVVVNQNSTNSVQLGNYYCQQRNVPPQNYLRIDWPGTNTDWANADFTNYLLNPLLAMLSSRQLTNQIDYVVLSMDIPYRVTDSSSAAINSTTSTLFYGFKPDPNLPCSIAAGSSNQYAGSEGIFRETPPISPDSNSFLVMMITASNLPSAKLVVDQGVASDSTFPTETVYLAKSIDTARNVRYALSDNAIFNTRLRGNYSMEPTNSYGIEGFGTILGAQTGGYNYPISGVSFVPGSMADNLTSYGGVIFQGNSAQLNILSFLLAGASGTYGTVDEPCNYLEKFPTPQDYFYQARGFSLAECYYQSITNPYQGLLLGEPLAAPFAKPAAGSWNNLNSNSLISGTTNLSVLFTASDAQHPLQQVDLFVDGTFLQTLTNIPPGQNNNLSVTLNGFTASYTVPAGASISSVASDLTAALNNSFYTNETKVAALAYGDRIELQSFDMTKSGAQVPVLASTSIGVGPPPTTFLTASRSTFLDTLAQGVDGYAITANPAGGDVLQITVTETNGTQVSLAVTNTGSQDLAGETQSLLDLINTNASPSLQAPTGLTASDLILAQGSPGSTEIVVFNLYANSPGWNASQISAAISGPAGYDVQPAGAQPLNQNLSDLEPRNHLYVTAGVTNLSLTFPFNSAAQANGFHDLTAVVYEGSHVRTQKRVTQTVQVTNGPLSATFTTLYGGSNTLVTATLQFSVVANTNDVAQIQLFSTGGLLAVVTNQSSALFSIPGANLDLGLHPFYAVVTTASGLQYRTQTEWIQLINTPEPPFSVSIKAKPPRLSWPATVGRTYNILSATNLARGFHSTATVTASNSPTIWTDPSPAPSVRFYQVQSE